MLHHVSVGVGDVVRAAEFYDAVLGALGYKRTAQYLPYAIAYGEGISEFWIQLPHDQSAPTAGNGVHVGFGAKNKEAVHRFHEAALAHGGSDAGVPGPRPQYGADYYGSFVRDPFGNKVEAVLLSTRRPIRRQRRKSRAGARLATKKLAGKSRSKPRGRSTTTAKPRSGRR